MEERMSVQFRDVAEVYFSQTRVDCRYTLSRQHRWSSRDWIGLFQLGWLTVKDYYTFAWALAPEGHLTGADVHCSVAFQPSYLPRPGEASYQFVYVDEGGEVCGVSSPFSFTAPRPLDELVTLEQEKSEDGDGDDLLLVLPKAHVLQSLLEGCQREVRELRNRFEAVELERESWKTNTDEFERVRNDMRSQIDELNDNLRQSAEKIEELQLKQKEAQSSHEHQCAEISALKTERLEHQQRIKELEQDSATLSLQKQDIEAELDRMKERVKKMTIQRRDEEKERRDLQAEGEQAQVELRALQERLEASERSTEALRRDISELGSLQSHSHGELHQVRLQAAQMGLQLSQANLALREGQATWAQEREALRQSAELDKERVQKLSRELQKKEEWLQEERAEREKLELELGVEKDCNRELRAGLRALQKEQEQHQLEKQELLDHTRVLELRLDTEADAKWAEAAALTPTLNISSAPSSVCEPDALRSQSPEQDDGTLRSTKPDSLKHEDVELCSPDPLLSGHTDGDFSASLTPPCGDPEPRQESLCSYQPEDHL